MSYAETIQTDGNIRTKHLVTIRDDGGLTYSKLIVQSKDPETMTGDMVADSTKTSSNTVVFEEDHNGNKVKQVVVYNEIGVDGDKVFTGSMLYDQRLDDGIRHAEFRAQDIGTEALKCEMYAEVYGGNGERVIIPEGNVKTKLAKQVAPIRAAIPRYFENSPPLIVRQIRVLEDGKASFQLNRAMDDKIGDVPEHYEKSILKKMQDKISQVTECPDLTGDLFTEKDREKFADLERAARLMREDKIANEAISDLESALIEVVEKAVGDVRPELVMEIRRAAQGAQALFDEVRRVDNASAFHQNVVEARRDYGVDDESPAR